MLGFGRHRLRLDLSVTFANERAARRTGRSLIYWCDACFSCFVRIGSRLHSDLGGARGRFLRDERRWLASETSLPPRPVLGRGLAVCHHRPNGRKSPRPAAWKPALRRSEESGSRRWSRWWSWPQSVSEFFC